MRGIVAISGLTHSVIFDKNRVKECDNEKKCPVVTISRDVGAGGGHIAELLAQQLGIPCYGYSMIDGIINEAKTDKHLMNLMDERYPSILEHWISNLILKGNFSKAEYHRRLTQTVYAIANTGGVILGRGAHLILANKPNVFRVRIEGSLEQCAKRVSKRENVTLDEAKKIIAERTKERADFLKDFYKLFPNNLRYSDLVINTDKASDKNAVEIILFAMEKMGHPVAKSGTVGMQKNP
ncbi:MAG: cytidylate kinase-like family protein [Magnetococcales bacterium]|nr:cytidylate kinase-like family protein [Magnetococcales bacterium]